MGTRQEESSLRIEPYRRVPTPLRSTSPCSDGLLAGEQPRLPLLLLRVPCEQRGDGAVEPFLCLQTTRSYLCLWLLYIIVFIRCITC